MEHPDWTWVLHSSLLIAAIYGRFTKVWSVRNLDIALLIGLSPALQGATTTPWFLYAVTAMIAIRLLADRWFQRRPRIDPNLNPYGLSFLCAAAFIVLTVNASVSMPPSINTAEEAAAFLDRDATTTSDPNPTATIITAPAVAISKNVVGDGDKQTGGAIETRDDKQEQEKQQAALLLAMKIVAVVSHAAVVLGLLILGYRRFGSGTLGLSMATLYLLLPCTAKEVHNVAHAMPAAFVVWAFVVYRRPALAGSLLAFGTGALFSTAFLIPLWTAFYGRRRAGRFFAGIGVTAGLLMLPLLWTSTPWQFMKKASGSINATVFDFLSDTTTPVDGVSPAMRLVMLVVFGCVLICVVVWPRSKQLSDLVAGSTALVVLAQLWYPRQIGMYVIWYLPLLLMVIFRPRLRHVEEEERENQAEATALAPEPQKVGGRSGVAISPLRR